MVLLVGKIVMLGGVCPVAVGHIEARDVAIECRGAVLVRIVGTRAEVEVVLAQPFVEHAETAAHRCLSVCRTDRKQSRPAVERSSWWERNRD